MIRNYINIAFRNLLKYRGYTTINFVGLSLGLTVGVLILLFVADELAAWMAIDNPALVDRSINMITSKPSLNLNFLENFIKGMDINPVIFRITPCITLFMAIVTVIVQTIKAGRMNPVDVLKAE